MNKLLFIIVIILGGLTVIAQQGVDPSLKIKGPEYIQSNYPPLRSGGDTYATATLIPGLPYSDNGYTCGATDDYSATCGCCGGSNGSPDLVYKFVPNFTGNINVSMNGFDTFMHIHDINGVELACNDDYNGLNAFIGGFPVTSGETYYIVCEGFSSNCGSYFFDIGYADEIPLSNWVIPVVALLIGTFIVLRRTRII